MNAHCVVKDVFLSLLLFLILSTDAASRHITVLIASFNNKDYYRHNLDSVFRQTYDNFHVIYTDDCSTDGMGELVDRYVAQNNLSHRIKVIHNNYNCGAMANHYRAVHMCQDEDLIVILDGDDAFYHDNVLATIERLHREKNCWVSYAQFKNLPEHKARECGLPVMGYARPTPIEMIRNKTYRRNGNWLWSGLRSFDAWLFKQIRLEDLLDNRPSREGKFFSVCCDNAYFFPMLEMAGERALFIPEVLLYRNIGTPLNDFKVKSAFDRTTVSNFIRSKRIYPTLIKPIFSDKHSLAYASADILVFADSIEQLPATFDAWRQLYGIGDIHVCYDNESDEAIKKIRSEYPFIILHNLEQESLAAVVNSLMSSYVILASSFPLKKMINITACIGLLEQTKASSFCLAYDKQNFFHVRDIHLLPVSLIADDVMVWQCSVFSKYNPSFSVCNRNATLYRVKDLCKIFQKDATNSIALCDLLFKNVEVDRHNICLSCITSPFKE